MMPIGSEGKLLLSSRTLGLWKGHHLLADRIHPPYTHDPVNYVARDPGQSEPRIC